MSRNDYTKYARENKVENPEAPIENPEVKESMMETESVSTETAVVEPEVNIIPARKIGRVFGCTRLNVRIAPKVSAEVVCEIPCDTEVEIDVENSTADFYKIFLNSGVEGHCMKKYINLISEN